jgi:hypothetical protein
VPRRPISAETMVAVRAAIQAGSPPQEICRQNGISPATYYRFKAATVREDAATKFPRKVAPRLTISQAERLCRFLPALPTYQETRVAEDVRQAAQATLYSSAEPRPSSVVIELEDAVAQARARPGRSIWLSRRPWVLVGGDPEDEERVLHRGKGRLAMLLAGLQLARDDVEESGDKRGGRPADARLRIFISNLGMIYETNANRSLTHSVDPASNALNSPFGLFVLEALRVLYPGEIEIPLGGVRTIIQHLAQFKPELRKHGPRKRTPA